MWYIREMSEVTFGKIKTNVLRIRRGYTDFNEYSFTIRELGSLNERVVTLNELRALDVYGYIQLADGEVFVRPDKNDLSARNMILDVDTTGILPVDMDFCVAEDGFSGCDTPAHDFLGLSIGFADIRCVDFRNKFFAFDDGHVSIFSGGNILAYLQKYCCYPMTHYERIGIVSSDGHADVLTVDKEVSSRVFSKLSMLRPEFSVGKSPI